MAVKSILEVSVEDAAFTKYKALFDQYQAELKKQPELWKQVSKQHNALSAQWAKVGDTFAKHLNQLEEAKNELEDQEKHVSFFDRLWSSIGKSSGTTAKHVTTMTTSFLKWSGLFSGFGTLAGYFSVEGIQRLVNDAADRRQQSLATGSTIGQLRAFGTDFARLGDSGILPAVNTMEADITQRRAWYSLGLPPMTGNTVTDAVTFANAVRDFARRTPLSLLGPLAQAYGLPEDISTLRTYANTPDAEWARLMRQARTDAVTMDVPPGAATALQNLATDFARNFQRVGTAFDTQLARATPALDRFANALSASAASFINYVGNGIAKEWKTIESGHPGAALLDTAKGSVNFLDALLGTGQPTFGPGGAASQYESDLAPFTSKIGAAWNNLRNAIFNRKLAGLDAQFGLPAGTLEVTRFIEGGTSFSPNASSKGALGIFQLMPATAKALGINPLDPDQAARGAAMLFGQLGKEFHGNLPEMLAAYNWRPDAVARLVDKYGDAWSLHLGNNKETANYLRRAAELLKPYGVQITIVNKTGADVNAAVASLGASP